MCRHKLHQKFLALINPQPINLRSAAVITAFQSKGCLVSPPTSFLISFLLVVSLNFLIHPRWEVVRGKEKTQVRETWMQLNRIGMCPLWFQILHNFLVKKYRTVNKVYTESFFSTACSQLMWPQPAPEHNKSSFTNDHTQRLNSHPATHTHTPHRQFNLLIISSTCCFVQSLSQSVRRSRWTLRAAPSSSSHAAPLGWEQSQECPLPLCCTHPGLVPANASQLIWALMRALHVNTVHVCVRVCKHVLMSVWMLTASIDPQPLRLEPKGQAISSVSPLRRALRTLWS